VALELRQRGRLTARRDPLERSTQFHWDSYRIHAVTDAAGQHTRLAYDAAGNLSALIAPDGSTTRWEHDARGRCHTVIDPNDNAQRREFDLLGRVTRVAEPDGNLRELEYDPEGNVVHVRDRDHDVRFEYQGMGRLTARTEAETRVEFRYDTEEQLVSIVNEHGAVYRFVLDPDSLGNLAAATYQDGRVDLRMPDAVGNLFKTSDRTDRKYGPAGQLLEASDARGLTRYEYDPEGNLCRKVEADGSEWRYRWSLTGMLVEVTRPDGEIVGFSYDALGRRLTKTFRGKTTRWIWDGNVPLHEWVELNDEARARDGEPLRSSFEREVAQAKRKAQLSRRSAQGPPELVYPSASSGSDEAEPASLRGAAEAHAQPPLVLEGTAEAPITWLFEPESFAPLGKLVADEQYSVVTDHLGTPRAMFDAHGQQAWAAEIDTYGQVQKLEGARGACPFRFPGQYEDEETGLYYNRFRYYDPEAGGYVSQDPIGLRGGLRCRKYTTDPTQFVDPLGLAPTPIDPALSRSHLSMFEGGSSVFVPRSVLEDIVPKFGQLGRPDGLFVTTPAAADAIEARAAGSRSRFKELLGIPATQWNEPIYRLDIPAADQRSLRMATGAESGANKHFIPGGYTSGGIPEAVIDPVPEKSIAVKGRCVAK
jgi:RHS repeat-associated protein